MNNLRGADLAREYVRLYSELGSWRAVGDHVGKSADTAYHVYDYWRKQGALEPSTFVDEPPSNVIPMTTPETDHDQWNNVLAALPDVYRVAFVSDDHIPDNDERAEALSQKIVHDFDPHLFVHGGDAFDFATIGRWEVDPEDVTNDVFQQINRPFLSLMRGYKDAAPNAHKVFVVGNHDERVYKFLTRQAPQLRYTVNQLFVDMIRKAGFLWLGWEATELQLPGLLVAHGTGIVSGVYPARRLADYCGFQVSALAGHCHRFDSWTRRGAKQHVYYQTSGCLCNLQPHYSTRRQNWQHGITLVTVTNGVPFMEAVPFVDYKAVWGGREYKA